MKLQATVLNRALLHLPAILTFLALSLFWSMQFQDKGVEYIRTSDTTDVFYGISVNAREERANLNGQTQSLWPLLLDRQLADWRECSISECYQSQFNTYLTTVHVATGDVTLAYKALALPLNFIYLLGCYALFLLITQNRAISLLFALLASLPVFIPLAGEVFGIGPYTQFSRRHLFTGLVPFALYFFFRYHNQFIALIPVLAFMGLIANLHASGILLIEIILLTYLLLHRWQGKSIIKSSVLLSVAWATGFIALGSLWRVVGDYLTYLFALIVPSAQAAGFNFHAGIDPTVRYLFYPPHIYSDLPQLVVHSMSAAAFAVAVSPLLLRRFVAERLYGDLLFASTLAILGYLVCSEFKWWLLVGIFLWLGGRSKQLTRELELTSLLVIATYLVSFALSVALQFIHLWEPVFPAIHNNLRGIRFLGLFLFVWLVALFAQIEWSKRAKPRRIALISVLVLAILVDLRHVVRSYLRQPTNIKEKTALLDVARWARDHTPTQAKFFVASSEFGIISERQVHMTNKSQANCINCPGAINVSGILELRDAARRWNMNYFVYKKLNYGSIVPDAVYQNADYALLAVH